MNLSWFAVVKFMASEFAHAVRQVELELTLSLLPKKGRLLEVGAGDGWQAKQLHDRGFDVNAVDIRTFPAGINQYFPVTQYDGTKLPFANGSFDVIYSSNVLEHIVNLDQMQRELARVLRPDGMAVHCVPSAIWRCWTTLGHPLYALQKAWHLLITSRNTSGSLGSPKNQRMTLGDVGLIALFRAALIPPRHGEYGNFVSEHWLFSRFGWEKRFKASGWNVVTHIPCGIFYTGNELMGLQLSNMKRQRLATILGSSTLIFILKPPKPLDSER